MTLIEITQKAITSAKAEKRRIDLHRGPQKRCHFYFYDNFGKCGPILPYSAVYLRIQ